MDGPLTDKNVCCVVAAILLDMPRTLYFGLFFFGARTPSVALGCVRGCADRPHHCVDLHWQRCCAPACMGCATSLIIRRRSVPFQCLRTTSITTARPSSDGTGTCLLPCSSLCAPLPLGGRCGLPLIRPSRQRNLWPPKMALTCVVAASNPLRR